MNMPKQVYKSHYNFASYMDKRRWASVWHQLDEVIAQQPDSVLEIGPGSGIFKNSATTFGLNVKTLDIDPELSPDYIASATDIPIADSSVDVACAFQVLEHMPFAVSMQALKELCRVAKKAVVISLPDVETSWASTLTIPKLGTFRVVLPRPGFRPQPHQFDGEHHWEISKEGYTRKRVISEIAAVASGYALRTYRVHENQYHRFFILEKPRHS
jgi:ubiquinone/menaquinone biosynthesis C-methylase UbiE